MRLFGFDINIQRRKLAPGFPSSTIECMEQSKPAAQEATGANYPDLADEIDHAVPVKPEPEQEGGEV